MSGGSPTGRGKWGVMAGVWRGVLASCLFGAAFAAGATVPVAGADAPSATVDAVEDVLATWTRSPTVDYCTHAAEASPDALAQARLASIEAMLRSRPADLALLRERAAWRWRLGQCAKAMDDVDQVLAAHADDAWVRGLRAFVEAGLGHGDAALADLDQAIALAPRATTLRLMDAELLAAAHRLPDAEAAVQAAVASDPACGHCYLTLADLQKQQGAYPAALASLEHAAAGGVDPSRLAVLRARLLRLQKQPELAEQVLTAALLGAPDDASLLDGRARAYVSLRRIDDALADLDHALRVRPDDIDPLYLRAVLHQQRGRLKDSLADLERLVALHFVDADMLETRAEVLFQLDAPEAAARSADEALAVDPKVAGAAQVAGAAYAKLRRDDLAFDRLAQALALNPQDSYALVSRSQLHEDRLEWRLATEDAEAAVVAAPQRDITWRRAIFLNRRMGQHARARELLHQLAAREQASEPSERSSTTRTLAVGLWDAGDPAGALPFLRAAVQDKPGDDYMALRLAFARISLGEADAARADLARRPMSSGSTWVRQLLAFVAGQVDDTALRASAMEAPDEKTRASQLCEWDFYVALDHEARGDLDGARRLMTHAANTCAPTMYEQMGAAARLQTSPAYAP